MKAGKIIPGKFNGPELPPVSTKDIFSSHRIGSMQEKARIEIATAAMAALIQSEGIVYAAPKPVAAKAVFYADALIEELKK